MELFLPSLFILVLSAAIVFGVIPRITPFFIFVIIVIFLCISLYAHYMMFKYEYTINPWRDTLAKSIPAVFGFIITVGLLVATLNLFTNIKIPFTLPTIFQSKPESIIKGYSNIPIEKIIELEKQL
jgi:hypothetical protein